MELASFPPNMEKYFEQMEHMAGWFWESIAVVEKIEDNFSAYKNYCLTKASLDGSLE